MNIQTPSPELARKFLNPNPNKNILQELRAQVQKKQQKEQQKKERISKNRNSRLIDAMACAQSESEFEKLKKEYITIYQKHN